MADLIRGRGRGGLKQLYNELKQESKSNGFFGAMKERRKRMQNNEAERPLKAIRERLKMKKQADIPVEERVYAQGGTAGGERAAPSERKLFTVEDSPSGR
jgi:hypothetical protein